MLSNAMSGAASDAVLICSGVVLLLAGLAVLGAADRGECSHSTASALLIGAAGGWCIAQALEPHTPRAWGDLLLPAGVALWVAGALLQRYRTQRPHAGRPMRRASDWHTQTGDGNP